MKLSKSYIGVFGAELKSHPDRGEGKQPETEGLGRTDAPNECLSKGNRVSHPEDTVNVGERKRHHLWFRCVLLPLPSTERPRLNPPSGVPIIVAFFEDELESAI